MKGMDIHSGIWFIVGVLIVVLLIGAAKSRVELVINFVLRGVLGMMSIYFLNLLLAELMPGMGLGYNPITFLTSGILGFPGVAMLYGINFYMLL
ncbi:MAG: pro-sigmaK processing inhibitor BofA family protein [Clostridium sp.]|nr:pro-sigmaK processing inhibitor BofA family protein [Clostridium sp.]